MAGSAALGQGQAARDAREGQRVLRGRPRALPQADGRGDHEGRRHRRHRPDRGQATDCQGPRRHRRLRQEPSYRPERRRLRGIQGDRRPLLPVGERCRRQAGVGGRHPRDEVHRGAQRPRRADRGPAGGEQGPGRQGHRGDQGRHQHYPRARLDAHRRARPRGRSDRRHRQGTDQVPGQPDRRGEGRHPQVQGQHRRPPAQGLDELAVRRAGRSRGRAARQVRPDGHRQAARLDCSA